MSRTYIYGIRDLEVQRFVWIGKSNTPQGRFREHMRHSHDKDVRKLVEEKGQDNFQLELLETVEFEVSKGWVKQEKFWIKKLRGEGHPLLNKNVGGGGATEHTEETKVKQSKVKSGENNPRGMLGRLHTEEWKRKESERKTGKNNPMYGRYHSEETKQIQSEKRKEWHRANAKSHLNFYNGKTDEFIPSEHNLVKCVENVV